MQASFYKREEERGKEKRTDLKISKAEMFADGLRPNWLSLCPVFAFQQFLTNENTGLYAEKLMMDVRSNSLEGEEEGPRGR